VEKRMLEESIRKKNRRDWFEEEQKHIG